jgi:hypothetical protein
MTCDGPIVINILSLACAIATYIPYGGSIATENIPDLVFLAVSLEAIRRQKNDLKQRTAAALEISP